MSDDEWIKMLADGRQVKFTNEELMGNTFMTAQVAGNEVVHSIILSTAKVPLSREEVERRFEHDLSK